MTGDRPRHGGAVILVSLIIALMLTILPVAQAVEDLPPWLTNLRPEWTALILLYWSLNLPDRVGVGCGWLLGLFQDALLGTLLGQHALAFAIIAYLAVRLHQHLRLVPLWQQAFFVFTMLLIAQLIVFWVNGLIGRPSPDWQAWAAVLLGALLWPALFHFMSAIRRRFQVQ